MDRIRAVEERARSSEREMGEVKGRMDKVIALGPRLDDLARTIADQRKEQADMNSVLLSEVSNLKLTLSPTIESRLKQHKFEINSLAQCINQYYTYITSLLYQPQSGTQQTKTPNIYTPEPTVLPASSMISAY